MASHFLKIDEENKTSESETHVYFWAGPFSQWARSYFIADLPFDETGRPRRFSTAEQYMMAAKASLFGDALSLRKIMSTGNPRYQKEWGRKVTPFDDKLWGEHSRPTVVLGNWHKFNQNPDLATLLIATGDRTLVEGSPYDRIYGVGLAWNDPRILDPLKWRGKNVLGKCLMEVRTMLREQNS